MAAKILLDRHYPYGTADLEPLRLPVHRAALRVRIDRLKAQPDQQLILLQELATLSPDDAAVARQMRDTTARIERERKAAVTKMKAEKRRQGIHVGMTAQDVLDSSWGRPEKINRTVTRDTVREQWVYGLGQYVYLVNGVVEAIDTRN